MKWLKRIGIAVLVLLLLLALGLWWLLGTGAGLRFALARASGFTDPLRIDFSARGFANYGSRLKIVLRRSGVADDSVIVMPTGMVQR